jgi:hypothetical protein
MTLPLVRIPSTHPLGTRTGSRAIVMHSRPSNDGGARYPKPACENHSCEDAYPDVHPSGRGRNGQLPGSAYMRCVVRWTCDHCRQDFYLDPNSVDMQAVLALTDTQCPECGHMGAAVTLTGGRAAG